MKIQFKRIKNLPFSITSPKVYSWLKWHDLIEVFIEIQPDRNCPDDWIFTPRKISCLKQDLKRLWEYRRGKIER